MEGEDDANLLVSERALKWGGSTTTEQQGSSSQINQIPQWVQNAGQQNYGLAQQVASQPLQQYQGQMVADVAPQTQQAWNLAGNSGNVGQDAQERGAGRLSQHARPDAAKRASGAIVEHQSAAVHESEHAVGDQFDFADHAQQQSRTAAEPSAERRQQRGRVRRLAAGRSARRHASPGRAEHGADGAATEPGQFHSGAGGRTGRHRQHAQGPAGANPCQSAALQQGVLANQASAGLGTLGNQQMQNNVANFGMLTAAGGQQQQQGQNDINAQLAKFNQAFQYPQQQLGMMESALGMTPYDTGSSGTSASTTTQTQSNPASMALGGLQTLGGLFSSGAGGTSAAAGLMSMFSDRRLKTDIQKVGTHSTGLPIYAYRFKGDPKSYHKVAGAMAEEVMKIAPHAVRPMTTKGHMAVHMPTLDALATPPSSPGVGRAIGALGKRQGPLQPGIATPPSRSLMPRMPILGALGG